jgi:hypothetical protein
VRRSQQLREDFDKKRPHQFDLEPMETENSEVRIRLKTPPNKNAKEIINIR